MKQLYMQVYPIKVPVELPSIHFWILLSLLSIYTIPSFAQEISFSQPEKITLQKVETGADNINNLLDSAKMVADAGETLYGLALAERAFLLSVYFQDDDLKIKIRRAQGDIAYFANNYDRSIYYYRQALLLANKAENHDYQILVNLDLGYAFYETGKPDSSQYYILQSLKINDYKKDTLSAIHSYRLLGDIHYGAQNYQVAYSHYNSGIEIIKNYVNPDEAIISEYCTLLGNQAGAAAEMGIFDEAKHLYAKSDSLANLIDDKFTLAFNAYGLGYNYIHEGKYLEAIDLCKNALQYFTDEEDLYSIEGCLECVARSYLHLNELDSAEKYLTPVLTSMHTFNFIDFKMDVYEQLAILYEKKSDFKSSLEYHKLFKLMSDSINKQNRIINLNLLEIQQRYEQAEKDNLALNASRSKDLQIISEQYKSNILITLALILVVICAITLAVFYKNKHNQSDRLETEVMRRTEELSTANLSLLEANAELEEFAHISSHDLREPIRNIVSFSSLIKRKGKNLSDAELNDFISLIQFNGNQMLQLVNDIYEFSKIKKTNLEFKLIPSKNIASDVIKLLSDEINKSSAIVKADLRIPEIFTNNNMIVLALRNIVENGIVYNRSVKPVVEITLDELGNEYIWSIKDNGIGIDPKYHSRIFEMFKRLHNREEYPGSGLGLAITKKIISRLKGSIEVNSEEGSGSEFIIHIPKPQAKQMRTNMKKAS